MPRKIASEVGSSVSRLLKVGSYSQPPAFYSALILHPPTSTSSPSRSSNNRPITDSPTQNPTPPNLNKTFLDRKNSLYSTIQPNDSLQYRQKRDALNSNKRQKAQTPKLNPIPIVYLSDRIRRQFFKDHPWELAKPRILTEMANKVAQPKKDLSLVLELKDWGRNPGVEE